jgi:hypothetical protein
MDGLRSSRRRNGPVEERGGRHFLDESAGACSYFSEIGGKAAGGSCATLTWEWRRKPLASLKMDSGKRRSRLPVARGRESIMRLAATLRETDASREIEIVYSVPTLIEWVVNR